MKTLIDLHTHTIVSGHAYSTVQENVQAAKEKGLKYIGLSDHAPSMPGGPHEFYFNNQYCIPDEINGVRVLKGIEANIMDYDGNIDVSEELAMNMDYLIISLHSPCIPGGTVEENTRAVIKAMNHNKVKVIGHLDDSRYMVDYDKVVSTAKEKNIALEINNSSLKPRSFRVGAKENIKALLAACKKYEAKVIMGSDAHISFDVGNFIYSEEAIQLNDFPKELVINYNEDLIEQLIKG